MGVKRDLDHDKVEHENEAVKHRFKQGVIVYVPYRRLCRSAIEMNNLKKGELTH